MDIESFVTQVMHANFTLDQVRAVAAANDLSLNGLLDRASLLVARRYQSEVLTFADADDIMNRVWALVCCQPVADIAVPEITREIFEAFDQGEYRHADDPPDIDPETKYTKPLLAKAMARWDA